MYAVHPRVGASVRVPKEPGGQRARGPARVAICGPPCADAGRSARDPLCLAPEKLVCGVGGPGSEAFLVFPGEAVEPSP